MDTTKARNTFPDPQRTRDQIRARIGAALRMALRDRFVTREEICLRADIDRRTLENWMNGYCDPSSWRMAVLGEILGQWFWMHVYGGDVGMAMYHRMQERLTRARTESDLAAAMDEIRRRG